MAEGTQQDKSPERMHNSSPSDTAGTVEKKNNSQTAAYCYRHLKDTAKQTKCRFIARGAVMMHFRIVPSTWLPACDIFHSFQYGSLCIQTQGCQPSITHQDSIGMPLASWKPKAWGLLSTIAQRLSPCQAPTGPSGNCRPPVHRNPCTTAHQLKAHLKH